MYYVGLLQYLIDETKAKRPHLAKKKGSSIKKTVTVHMAYVAMIKTCELGHYCIIQLIRKL